MALIKGGLHTEIAKRLGIGRTSVYRAIYKDSKAT